MNAFENLVFNFLSSYFASDYGDDKFDDRKRMTKKSQSKKLANNERNCHSSIVEGIKRYANLSPSIEKNWENFVNKGIVKVRNQLKAWISKAIY